MASPLKTAKPTVNLAAKPAVPGSRIRRAPPPPAKEEEYVDPAERDARTVMIGVLSFALAIVVIIVGFSSYNGWTPREYVAHL